MFKTCEHTPHITLTPTSRRGWIARLECMSCGVTTARTGSSPIDAQMSAKLAWECLRGPIKVKAVFEPAVKSTGLRLGEW